MGDQTQTQTTQIGAMSDRARQALSTLQSASLDFQDPDFSLTDQDQMRIDEIRRRQMDLSRQQIGQNRAYAEQGVQEQALSRGIEGSTMGAILAAMLGLQEAGALNQGVAQGPVTAAQQAMELPFQRGQMELATNQAKFQQLLAGLTPILNYDMMERQGNTTTTMKQSGGLVPSLVNLGAQAGMALATGGASIPAQAAGYGISNKMGSDPTNAQNQYWSTARYDPRTITYGNGD